MPPLDPDTLEKWKPGLSQRGTAIRRVLLVLQSFSIGGMDTHCLDLAAEYVRRGLRVAAVIPEGAPYDELAVSFRRAGAGVRRLTTDPRLGRARQLNRLWQFGRFCHAWRPDAIHLHTGQAHGGVGVVALARAVTRATVVFTEHEVPLLTEGEYSSREHAGRRAMLYLTHAMIAVSRRNAALRQARLGAVPQRVAAVLNGVPVPLIVPGSQQQNRDRIRSELGIGSEATVFGSVVRLAEGKGLDDLLRAFAFLCRDRASELLLVGDGPLRSDLEALAGELRIRPHVHLVGHQETPAPYVDAMDVFVLAVPSGSMSIALLEAMGRGVPPVITFCGPEEAVIPEETGLCAPPGDAAGLAAVLLRLAGDPLLRARLGGAAAEHVRRHFSVQRVADDLLELYAAARRGAVPARVRADGPPNPRPVAQQETVPDRADDTSPRRRSSRMPSAPRTSVGGSSEDCACS